MAENVDLLQIEDLAVRYGNGSRAVERVSLRLPAGGIVAVLGPNGAGKTTVLRAVTGLLPFHGAQMDQGRILLDGSPIDSLDVRARVNRGIAQVMEGRRIFAELTVLENLQAGGHACAVSAEKKRDTMEHILGFFPILRERLHGVAGYLSGGEQQMLAIGRALMARPRLLVLDEPSLGIAPKVVAQISSILQRVNRSGVSILLVEQNAGVALDLAHHALVLEGGQVAMAGRAADLKADPAVRAAYLGMSGGRRRSYREEAPA